MDWQIFHTVDEFSSDYKWLAHSTWDFETIGVVAYVLAVVLLWFATAPGEDRRWKLASLAGIASAGISLGINQIIGNIWHRPRPYESHPGVYHLTQSHDPSFPSDHASGAFGIAWGIYFIDRRVGRVFLAAATLIAFGRLLVGAHYLSDVLASLAISAAVGWFVSRFGRGLLLRIVMLLERVSDPVVRPLFERWHSGRRTG